MYEAFFGLKEKPFNLLPDPEFLYMSPGHENAYSHLEYAVAENKGFVAVTGEIGSGKTTLINFLLQKVPQDIQIGIINNTDVNPLQFLKMVCQEFEIEIADSDKAELLDRFNRFLVDQFSKRKRVTLIIDEAQNLPRQTMEEVRMLSNLEAEKQHLIQIILVGQPELRAKLQSRGLEQFAQRITVQCHLDGLTQDDVEKYIRHRLHVAGAASLELFDKDAVSVIHSYSRGIPRLINILCDTALVYGYADDQKTITRQIIQNVIDARQIGGMTVPSAPSDETSGLVERITLDDENRFEKRLEAIEWKLLTLENNLASLQHKVDSWMNVRDKNGILTYELFQMLKKSLDSRKKVVAKYIELRQEVEKLDKGVQEPDSKPGGSVFLRFRGRPKKKT